MADARAIFDINGIDYLGATFAYDNTIVFDKTQSGDSAQYGLAVKLVGNGTVGLTTDASAVHGKLLKVEQDGWCTVQIDGGAKMDAGGNTVTAGSKIVGALSTGSGTPRGYFRNVAAATLAEVAVARHTVMDATDNANVQVWFD